MLDSAGLILANLPHGFMSLVRVEGLRARLLLHRDQWFLAGSTAGDIEHRYQLAASPISGTRRPPSPPGSLGCRQRVSGSGKLAPASTLRRNVLAGADRSPVHSSS